MSSLVGTGTARGKLTVHFLCSYILAPEIGGKVWLGCMWLGGTLYNTTKLKVSAPKLSTRTPKINMINISNMLNTRECLFRRISAVFPACGVSAK